MSKQQQSDPKQTAASKRESARATQSLHNITYLDGAIAHVGDAERKRGSALVDLNLLSVGRQHLAEADALLGLAENLEVGNRQKRALKTTAVTPAAGKDAGGAGKGRGGLRILHELMAKQRAFFPCWGFTCVGGRFYGQFFFKVWLPPKDDGEGRVPTWGRGAYIQQGCLE